MCCVPQFQLLYMNKDPRKPRLRGQLQMTFYSTTGNILAAHRIFSFCQSLTSVCLLLELCLPTYLLSVPFSPCSTTRCVLGLPSHTSTSAESCNPLVHNVTYQPAYQNFQATLPTLAGYVRPSASDFLHPGYQRIQALL